MKNALSVIGVGVSIALMSNAANALDLEFSEVVMPVAADDVTVSDTVTVNGNVRELAYKELYRTGQMDTNGEVYGLMKDYKGHAAEADPGTGVPYVCSGSVEGVRGSGTDFTALLEKHGKKYMVTQFECQNGGMYMSELRQNARGNLFPVPGTLQFIDNRNEWGGWVHCAGSVTPWNTYLGGEEYEPNAKALEADPTGNKYYNDKVEAYWLGDYSKSSPYHNGWITEVDILKNGKATYAKHYAMGRFSHELGYVMPDGKTVYLTDDGTNDTLFMFIADQAGNLSRGTLYAAKWNQTSGFGGGSAQLEWINLGKANNHQIRKAIKKGIAFSDMFYENTPNCKTIGANGSLECLEVKPGKAKLASRLESRRYAALMGATYEFRKMEGFTFDSDRNQAYIAISEVGRGMLDNAGDPDKGGKNYDDLDSDGVAESGNHVRVSKPDYCGAIYAMDVMADVKDSNGKKIKSDQVVINMNSILASGTESGEISPEECALNNDIMAQPDNITKLDGSNTLEIGEDGKHQNNMIWSLNLDTRELTRIVTVPEGAETTSPYYHKLGGRTYMTVVSQHPDESASNQNGDSLTGVIGIKK